MKTIDRKHVGITYRFVDLNMAKQMISDGFKGPFYGRYCIDSEFEDPVLYGPRGAMLDILRYPDGCIPLPTVEQFKEFYDK